MILQAQISPTVEDAIMEVALDPGMESLLESTLHIGSTANIHTYTPII